MLKGNEDEVADKKITTLMTVSVSASARWDQELQQRGLTTTVIQKQ